MRGGDSARRAPPRRRGRAHGGARMRRIVVIGDGMVGSRFTADIVAADPDAHVTVLGKEPHAAYNRVLLSSVVAGSKSPELLSIAQPAHARVSILTGVGAASIDPELGM